MSRYSGSRIATLDGEQFYVAEAPLPVVQRPARRLKTTFDPERIDLIAYDRGVGPTRWDRIMALNPEYMSPDDIDVGEIIRVPR